MSNSSLISTASLTDINFKFRELNFKEYRTINKCLLGDKFDINTIFLNVNEILTNCILQDKKENIILNLNYIDYIIFLLLIRTVSLGNSVRLNVKNSKINDLTIDIDLSSIIELLQKIDYSKILTPSQFETPNTLITYQLPTIANLILFSEQIDDSFYNFFIKEITVENKTIPFNKLSLTDQNTILKQIPAKYFTDITKKVQNIVNIFNNVNFFASVYDEELFNTNLPLIPNAEGICFIIKLLFNTDLDALYGNIFALINASHFSGEYLDSCTPGEFYVFCKKLELYIKEQNKQSTSSNTLTNQFVDNLPPIVGEEKFGLE